MSSSVSRLSIIWLLRHLLPPWCGWQNVVIHFGQRPHLNSVAWNNCNCWREVTYKVWRQTSIKSPWSDITALSFINFLRPRFWTRKSTCVVKEPTYQYGTPRVKKDSMPWDPSITGKLINSVVFVRLDWTLAWLKINSPEGHVLMEPSISYS